MITLPYTFKSGKTLLAELTPEHYITSNKKVVAKLTADNLWATPVKPIEPTGNLILLDDEYQRLTADWHKYQEWLDEEITKHLQGLHDQSSHGRKGPIKAGYKNWNPQLQKLLEDKDQIDSTRGNALLATVTEAAGFNEKPTILSQAEFDALEGETLYRGVTDEAFIGDFKESLVQYAGEGSFGNGTYATNDVESTRYYTGAENNYDRLTMEMKLLPDANVMSFNDPYALKEWRSNLAKDFVEQYKATGANPAEVLEVEWNLANDSDWTNIAIMNGIDAIRFNPIGGTRQEFYTIILNRGKVAINGKS